MADRQQPELGRYGAALVPLHEQIRGICERVGIDVKAAERYAKESSSVLPWDESAKPQSCIERTRKILAACSGNTKSRDKLRVDLSEEFYNELSCPLGFVAASEVVSNTMLSEDAKAAFLSQLVADFYEEIINPEHEEKPNPEAIPGAVCWIVHDILAAQKLEATCSDPKFKEVSGALMHRLGLWIVQTAGWEANEDNNSFELIKSVENTLMRLPQIENSSVAGVTKLLRTISPKHKEQEDQDPPFLQLESALSVIYPEQFFSTLDSSQIAKEANHLFRGMADSFALSDFVKEKLTSSPEWTNPLGEAAEQIRSGSTTYLYFDDADIVRSSKAREVLLDLVEQCPSTKFVFPVQLFFTRGEGDPSFKDLSAELNIFVDTDLSSSIVSKTSQPNFEDQKARVVGFLREIVAISGSKKVSIVSPEEIEATSNSDSGPTCVLKKGIPDKNTGKSEKAIQISLKLKDADDRSVQRLKECLELWDYKPGFLVNGALSSALGKRP